MASSPLDTAQYRAAVAALLNRAHQPHPAVEPLTSPNIKHLAGVGLEDPSKLTVENVRSLCASVLAHIEPRKTGR